MNRTYFKAVHPDGTDFHTGTVHWLPAGGVIPEGGWLVDHPHPGQAGDRDAVGYLSAATVETDCTGFSWPARLLSVEPVGDVWTPHPESFPRKRAAHAWRVVGELPAWQLLGPQGRTVLDIIEQVRHLTSTQMDDLTAARWAALDAARWAALDAARHTALAAALNASRYVALDAARWTGRWSARNAAQDAAMDGTLDAAWDADWDAAWDATWCVVLGWLVKDLISVEDFRALTGPWASVMGPIEVAA